MRGLRESLKLLTRSPGLLTTLPLSAACSPSALAAPATQTGGAAAAAVLQREAAALRRWLHSGSTQTLWRQHIRQQQQRQQRQQQWQWWRPPAGAAAPGPSLAPAGADTLWLRHFTSSSVVRAAPGKPRGRRDLYDSVNKKVTDQGWYIMAITVAMIGLTYAAVPLYRMFCQATGYGGTVIEGRAVEEKIRRREQNPDEEVERAAAAREVTVYFNSDVADGMPWRFKPTQRSVKLHPGQSTLAFYTAHNTSDKAITGVSTYNVAPQQAGQYFNKIQCFCFEEQKLRPGEKIDMPVFFYIDPEFATDPKMNGINIITLSYTFFKVVEEDWEDEEPVAAVAAAAAAAPPLAAAAQ